MSKLIYMVGLPGSGKSTKAKEIAEEEDAIILSSDQLRIEMFGDVNEHSKNKELFEKLYNRAENNLSNNKNVIIDATNINYRRRKHILQHRLKKYYDKAICYYMNISMSTIKERNFNRKRNVPEKVIKKMCKRLYIPIYSEGWDEINFITDLKEFKQVERKKFKAIVGAVKNENIFPILGTLFNDVFHSIYKMPQDTSYHSLSVSRHILYTMKYIKKLNSISDENKFLLLVAALFHDLGKGQTKKYKGKYASYIGHENVSAQIAALGLIQLGFDKEFIMKVIKLVQYHMRLYNAESKKSINKIIDIIGKDDFELLKILHDADKSAK